MGWISIGGSGFEVSHPCVTRMDGALGIRVFACFGTAGLGLKFPTLLRNDGTPGIVRLSGTTLGMRGVSGR